MTAALQLRHRLIPYIYTMAVQSATPGDDSASGQSLIKPLYHDYPEQPLAYHNKNQYMFGSQILVSPITSPQHKSTMMGSAPTWLPPILASDRKLRWVDIFSGMVYKADRIVELHRRLEDYPVLACEGAIILLDSSSELENDCPLPKSIEVIVVVGHDGLFELIEDDGTGSSPGEIAFSRTLIHFDQSAGTLTIEPTTKPLLLEREWSIRLVNWDGGSRAIKVSVVDPNIKYPGTEDSFQLIDTKVETVRKDTVLSLGLISASSRVMVYVGELPELAKNDVQTIIFDLLDSFQILRVVALDILNIFRAMDDGLEITLSRLRAIKLDPEVLSAVEEILLADPR